jgi:hypothetical protein
VGRGQTSVTSAAGRLASFQQEAAGLDTAYSLGPCRAIGYQDHHSNAWSVSVIVLWLAAMALPPAVGFAIFYAVLFGILAVLEGSSSGHLRTLVVVLGLGLGLLAGIAALVAVVRGVIRVLRRWKRTERVFVFQRGVARRIDGEPADCVIYWDDAVSAEWSSWEDNDGVRRQSCTIRGRAGIHVEVDSDFRSPGPVGSWRDGGFVGLMLAVTEEELARRLLPGLIGEYQAGSPVSLCGLTVGQPGISYAPPGRGPRSAPALIGWPEIQRITLDRHLIEIQRAGQRRPITLPSRKREPVSLLTGHLIRYAATHTGGPDVPVIDRPRRR